MTRKVILKELYDLAREIYIHEKDRDVEYAVKSAAEFLTNVEYHLAKCLEESK